MPGIQNQENNQTLGLRAIVRKFAPWYSGAASILGSFAFVCSWLKVFGITQVSQQVLIFNVLSMIGIASVFGAIFGSVGLVFGWMYTDDFPNMEKADKNKIIALAAGIPFSAIFLYLLWMLVWDPRDWTGPPDYNSWWPALLGALVLIAGYVFLGRKLFEKFKASTD